MWTMVWLLDQREACKLQYGTFHENALCPSMGFSIEKELEPSMSHGNLAVPCPDTYEYVGNKKWTRRPRRNDVAHLSKRKKNALISESMIWTFYVLWHNN